VLSEILAAEGATVEAGGKLAVIGGSGGRSAAAAGREAPAPAAASAGGKDVANAPSAEKLMAEKGLDAARSGHGP
jgi:2-oxoglutarate dehydrogenase E2 component (dihydrolipoamide succinyltransferase)